MKPICSKMEYMQVLAIRRINKGLGQWECLGAWLALPLVIVLSCAPCHAQDASHCGHSTVEDAWGATVASEAKSFLIKLQSIVKTNNKKQFASLVHYPIRVLDGDHSTEIYSPSDFVEKYSSIVTSDVRHAISVQPANCLFANGQGMMIGRGQLWFQKESSGDMKIITINLRAPKVGE